MIEKTDQCSCGHTAVRHKEFESNPLIVAANARWFSGCEKFVLAPYSVNYYCSHPDAGNDDCETGHCFVTKNEALEAFAKAPYTDYESSGGFIQRIAYIQLDGPDVHEVRKNPEHIPQRKSRDDFDAEWRREIAMEAGMGLGVDAYNDAMGY